MKKIIRLATLTAFAGIVCLCICAQKINAQEYDGAVSFQTFYDELAPFGQWINDPQYGYVWVPDAEDDFRPYYTQGHWVMTDYGNTWVSDYQWGWAPFHYGRWMYDSYYGWVWVPGTTWGPAWVSWRYSDEYCGWAPLSPGIEIGLSYGGYFCPDDWWVFIPPTYLYWNHYYGYWYGPDYNTQIIARTPFLNNTFTNGTNNVVYVIGPRASQIERVSNRPVIVYPINTTREPGRTRVHNNALNMYHPMTVNATRANGNRPVPPIVSKTRQAVGAPKAVGATPPPYRAVMRPNNFGTPASGTPREMPGEHVPQSNAWYTQPEPTFRVQQPAQPQTVQPMQQQPRPLQQVQPVQRQQPSSQGNIHVVQPTQSAPRSTPTQMQRR